MKTQLKLSVILFPVLFWAGSVLADEIYVSPTGDDVNLGTPQEPVACLQKALELSRKLPADKAKRIVLMSGMYFDTGIILTADDSNLTIESAGDDKATLVGGVPLAGWKRIDERFWSASLPAGRDLDVRMLSVNGRFCPRARIPEVGVLEHRTVFDSNWLGTYYGKWSRWPSPDEEITLKYKREDIPDDLDLNNAEITVFHVWDESTAKVIEHDRKNAAFRLSPKPGFPPGAFGVQEYCIWNVQEGMTRPGQWYFDRTARRIVYWPLPNEDMASVKAFAPTQRSILHIEDAKNIVIRNLDLTVATTRMSTSGFAANGLDGAVQAVKADNIVLSGLHISNVAGHAIKTCRKTRGGRDRIRVENCAVSNCGAGGIYVDGVENAVYNNCVHDVGLMFPAGVGVYLRGNDSCASHNEVHDTTYTGIVGHGDDLTINNNLIGRCMKELHDGGGIYVMGNGITIRNNVVRDVKDTGRFGASAYYIDERSENCVIEENISVDVVTAAKGHIAQKNTIRNNVFINRGEVKIAFPRSIDYAMQGNVVYAAGKITIDGVNCVATWSKNLFYSGEGRIDGVVMKERKYDRIGTISGVVGDTAVGDPMFVDLDHLDLQYKPDSPAWKLGLKPLNISQAGREDNDASRQKEKVHK